MKIHDRLVEPRGQLVAEAARAKHKRRLEPETSPEPAPIAPTAPTAPTTATTATTAPSDSATEPLRTYGRPQLQLNLHIRDDQSTGGTRVILEEGAALKIDAHVGTLTGGGGTLIVERGAQLHLNLHADTASAPSGEVRIAPGTTIKANVHLRDVQPSAPAAKPGPVVKAEPAPKIDEAETLQAARVEAREKAERANKPDKPDKLEKLERTEDRRPADLFVDMRNLRWHLLRDLLITDERPARKPEHTGMPGHAGKPTPVAAKPTD